MDRLSRDQEDIAGLFKRMAFAGVTIVTLSEGEVTNLHVGLKGSTNALFLKDLADKVRRGLGGRVALGKSGGGNSFGYDVVKQLGGDGQPLRGDRRINEAEANVIRRIFRDYGAGKSPKKIAFELNAEGIAGPSGGAWGFSSILGSPKRGNGILNNELYIGRIVWNRQRFIKDPETGKRVSRLNPRGEWVVQEVPELRIVDQDLWEKVKARQQRTNKDQSGAKGFVFRERRRVKYLFSGLTRCACCNGGYTIISKDLLGCATARNKGTYPNRLNIRRDQLEPRILHALRHRLVDPTLFKEFCDEFTREMNRLRMEGRAALDAQRKAQERIARRTRKLVVLITEDDAPIKALKEELKALEARQAELDRILAEAEEPPPLLHPNMAEIYRSRLTSLHEALGREETRTEGRRDHPVAGRRDRPDAGERRAQGRPAGRPCGYPGDCDQ
jgi:site-specific DNA recombinase